MRGLKYQLKSIGRDKMCILTFLLPVMAGLAINLLSGVSFQSMGITLFGVVQGQVSEDTIQWLQQSGRVMQFESMDALQDAVNDPSTQMIGVFQAGDAIQTFISGDELEVNRVIADTLPQVYKNRMDPLAIDRTVVPVEAGGEGLKSLLIAMTLVAAMFMGCTYNAMNIISEKEDGIEFVNQVLPMTARAYGAQKMLLGFMGGMGSTVAVALVCMRIELAQMLPFLLITLLSAYLSALLGLFIGAISNGLMVGIVYIKIIMVLFLAPPIFFYLIVPGNATAFWLSYLLPSSAMFYGIMDLLDGQFERLWPALAALLAHTVFWSIAYKRLQMRKRAKG